MIEADENSRRIVRVCIVAVGIVLLTVIDNGMSWAVSESATQTEPAPLVLTLRGALAAAVDNNPDVLLYKFKRSECENDRSGGHSPTREVLGLAKHLPHVDR